MTTESGLRRLVVTPDVIAEDEIADALERYVRLTPEGDVVFHEAFGQLKAREQVLCLLLALRAAEMLGLRGSCSLTPQEVSKASGMAGGTVRPKLSALVKARLVSKDEGKYCIPIHAVAVATRTLLSNPVANG